MPQYILGIDLGTTNSALAYVPAGEDDQTISLFSVPQLVNPGEVAIVAWTIGPLRKRRPPPRELHDQRDGPPTDP